MSEVTIVLPAVSEGGVSADLRDLTQTLHEHGSEISAGILGGVFGYGAHFENETFEMFPFYWGDCECGFSDEMGYTGREADWLKANQHSEDCYQSEIRRRGFTGYDTFSEVDYDARERANKKAVAEVCAEMGLDPKHGSYVHCTCGRRERYVAWRQTPEGNHDTRCGVARPNFLHKPSGLEIRWYKYIGRGMEFSRDVDRNEWRRIRNECLESLER